MQSQPLSSGIIGARVARFAQDTTVVGSTLFRTIRQLPDMVNGPTDGFSFIFVAPGLPMPYHWISDAVYADLNLGGEVTEAQLDERIISEAALHSIMLTADGTAAPKARMIGVILAVGRIALRRSWNLVNADIVASQLLTLTDGGNGPVTVNRRGALSADVPGMTTRADYNTERNEIVDTYAAIPSEFLANVAKAAVGMPACNGCTIVTTLAHHYVDPHKQICDSVIDQCFTRSPAIPAGIDVNDLKDVVCHKTAHPVQSPKLVHLARSLAVKERLVAAGLGSAAVRIPAQFTPERTASAFRAIVHRTAAAGGSSNVVVSTTPVDEMAEQIKAELERNPNVTGIMNSEGRVSDFKQRYGADVAWMAGFLTAMFAESNAPARARTVVAAYGVKTLVEEHSPSFAEGAEHYALAQRWRRARAREGHLAGYGLMGAQQPPAYRNPEQEN